MNLIREIQHLFFIIHIFYHKQSAGEKTHTYYQNIS